MFVISQITAYNNWYTQLYAKVKMMDLEQLNRIAQQVAAKVQEQAQVQAIRFTIWQRGFTDPDAYTATGIIFRKGQGVSCFSLALVQILDLLAQTDEQAAQTLESLLMHHVSQAVV